jgi:hypothetical protein
MSMKERPLSRDGTQHRAVPLAEIELVCHLFHAFRMPDSTHPTVSRSLSRSTALCEHDLARQRIDKNK